MIGIVDYGMGNLFSVSKALERMNVPYFISSEQETLAGADGLLLPGVGSFHDAMNILQETRLAQFLKAQAANGKPLLGICLGMQLLFDDSEENGKTAGLGLLKGNVVKFPDSELKVPHMGWNKLRFQQASPLLTNVPEEFVYFVHSYYVKLASEDTLIASSNYGVTVPAVVGEGNVFGTQFHPEKSSEVGIAILQNFVQLVEGVRV